ncbi:MAG TPA: DUF4019 domain-containing protein [Verrucomicrobiae bacterium]|nr:DUF4019 domain-containing protein [Verrucomicrobiae bacterium]
MNDALLDVGKMMLFICGMILLLGLVAAVMLLLAKFLWRQFPPESPEKKVLPKCPKCGAPLPADSPEGLCPRCLVAMNLATQTELPGETGPHGTQINKPPPSPPLPVSDIAKLFPQLEILECLGRGGMGAVYKARQPRLDRVVALKILSPEKQNEPKFAERFEREARALAKLHHPNIVTVYDFGEVQGNFYLLMEFVDGLTLRQLIQSKKLSAPEALTIVPKICEALQYAHEQGIVHRDIKPENILLDKTGRVKIADFGIAKILGDGERANLTAEQVIGTPHYMSPEQIEKPEKVDHRADIYSLGVVFYEMLTGELPLGKFLPPSSKVQIDVRLDEVVLRALEKEPERRYQQASEVKTRVETIASENAKAGESPKSKTAAQDVFKKPFESIYGPPRDNFWGRLAIRLACLIMILFIVSVIGILAAMAIPAFVHARNQMQAIKSDYIGQTWFPLGDSIEITDVGRNGNLLTIAGHYNLVSHEHATLALYVTTTNTPDGKCTPMEIKKGTGDFSLAYGPMAPGLPHVSMYADGKAFASLYFGTKDEAAEESKASWITNAPTASLQTWSPAPGEKVDLQKIYYSAKSLADAGSYEDALQRYLWYFDHSRTNASQQGVRLSFALSDWIDLGRLYPKARRALIEIRDGDARQFSEGRGDFKLFMEVNSISHYLGDDDVTYSLFKQIEPHDQQLAQQCFPIVESLLAEHGDYQKCLDYIGDPQAAFEKIQKEHQRMKQFEEQDAARREEQRKRFEEMAKTNSAFAHLPPLTELPKFADDNFVKKVRELIEILIATDHKDEAVKIRDEAVNVLDDRWLKSAVEDMEKKINSQRGVSTMTFTNSAAGGTIQVFPGVTTKVNPSTGLPVSSGGTGAIDPATGLPRRSKDSGGTNAISEIETWLALMDSGDYAKSWEQAADSFHDAVSKNDWVATSEKVRAPLGKLISRKVNTTEKSSHLAGMPDGDYFVAVFDTDFAQFSPAKETVSASLDERGQWKVIGYLIQPADADGKISDRDKPVVSAAESWLQLIDGGGYAQSWKGASESFQQAITQSKWVSALESVRKPLGALASRKLQSEQRMTQLPGMPDGQYVLMQFDTSFANKKSAVETLTFMLEKDGQWKAAGYYIR